MEKNVVSVDLDELLKARQELNSSMGLETDPNMYKDYNPNRKNEEAEAQENSQNQAEETDFDAENLESEEVNSNAANEQIEDTDFSAEEQTSLENNAEENNEVNFSVYDNFASFEINPGIRKTEKESSDFEPAKDLETPASSENVEPNIELSIDVEPNIEKTEKATENVEENIEEENVEDEEDLSLSDEIDRIVAMYSNGELPNETTETAEAKDVEADSNQEIITDSGMFNFDDNEEDEKNNENETSVKQEEDVGNTQIDDLAEFLGVDKDFVINYNEENESLKENEIAEDTNSDIVEESNNDENIIDETKISDENEELAQVVENSAIIDDEVKENEEKENEENHDEVKVDAEKIDEVKEESSTLSENEKYIQNFNTAENESEQKIKDTLANISAKTSNSAEIKPENMLKPIDSFEFIDVIGSSDFENCDKLSYVLGLNESGKYEFASLQKMYNVAIFAKEDDSAFKFFNSMILGLMLKNSKDELNFYFCDTETDSVFDSYATSSYLGAPLAKNQNDILNLLTDLVSEIDERYENIASSGVKNIEEYNRAMAESYILELPYCVLFFNNYINVSNIDDWAKIKECLAYILKFGRLVGVYVYIRATDEILDESINYALASRIAYKADTAEDSLKQIGEFGAELISGEGEFILKTIISEKAKHIKSPNITSKEVELLNLNIER